MHNRGDSMQVQDSVGDPDDPAAIVAELESRARRIETPCGSGHMVWRVWGAPSTRHAPLVLGHGSQGAWSHWIRNIAVLAQHRLVIAVDLPGQGGSAMPATPDHAGISAALAAGLPEIPGVSGPVDMAGFSFGGVAFAWLAAQYPELVRRLVLIGCGGLGTPHGHVDLRPAKGLQGEARRAVLKSNLLGLMLHYPGSVDELAMHLLVLNGRLGRLSVAELVLPDRLLAALAQVQAQVDAIWGEFDRPHPGPPLQEAALRISHPDADFRVIAGAGHWAMYEQPKAFNAALTEIIDAPLRSH
jgi:pimeloyl-ACP methyl ester carboxylesterase